MPATTNGIHAEYHRIRKSSHPGCLACDPENRQGLGLEFHPTDDGAVEASFSCEKVFQGYPAILHGGIICTVLDAAMTNCLFALGRPSLTVEIKVRFRHQVAIGQTATVRGRIVASMPPIHDLEAELIQDGKFMATAKAKFIEKATISWFGKG
jgi:acyl-coenzyme A thioesterase PaaI-like protein